MPELERSGWFSATIARRLGGECRQGIESPQRELEGLRSRELGAEEEHRLVFV